MFISACAYGGPHFEYVDNHKNVREKNLYTTSNQGKIIKKALFIDVCLLELEDWNVNLIFFYLNILNSTHYWYLNLIIFGKYNGCIVYSVYLLFTVMPKSLCLKYCLNCNYCLVLENNIYVICTSIFFFLD